MQIGAIGETPVSWDWVTGEVYVGEDFAGRASTEEDALAVARQFDAYNRRCLQSKYA